MNHQRLKKSLGSLVGIALAGSVVGLIILSATRPRPGEKITDQGNLHLKSETETHVPYNSKPPTSGPHYSKAPWGISSVQIPDEIQVHNLEDGGVIVHYDPAQVTTSTIQQLTQLVQPRYINGKRIILEPYAKLDAPIVLTAWTRMQKLSSFDEQAILQFMNAYEGRDHHVPGQ